MTSFCKNIYESLCKKYPNRNIYVIGNHHFFHKNIIYYTRSNFSNIEEMNRYIINIHNDIIEKMEQTSRKIIKNLKNDVN